MRHGLGSENNEEPLVTWEATGRWLEHQILAMPKHDAGRSQITGQSGQFIEERDRERMKWKRRGREIEKKVHRQGTSGESL